MTTTTSVRLITVLALVVGSTAALAETFVEAISNCRELNNRERRYACYDDAEAYSGNVQREVAAFNYEATSDPLTGQTEHQLTIRSAQGLNGRGDPIVLLWQCDSTAPGRYTLTLRWEDFLPSGRPEVTTRLGQQAPVTGRWQAGSYRESSILDGPDTGFTLTEFVTQVAAQIDAGHTTMVFRTRPYNDDPITAVFDFTGFTEVVEPMRQSCRF
ncbi:hypothetical protein BGP77_06065 [Saccharospirillum sp. MSK14-1]|uniref:hypothetical protein n=1 Tax=Saccharospirillum sp. MSK14-1 TaxID=1897632 RepID=UPI000D3A838C|nr:hypothetical protein [Saccharospirillum sp. MSK14-1]PTY36850.1 hypothetical protein BGP77_06065 [Saccharospirillum sp. MSK14-1]